MKKLVLIPIIALLLSGAGLVATVASYPVEVNGEPLNATVLNSNGTTYLPLKAVGQALGADVSWNGKGVEVQTVDVDRLKESCVMIKASDGETYTQGSGVYIGYGEVLTAYHIVDEGKTNITDFKQISFTTSDYDETLDAAILTPSEKGTPVKIGDSDEIQIGDKVIVVASPKAKEDTVVYTSVINFDPRGIVIKTTLGGGASGGAVFDVNGCLIGIIIAADGTTDTVETKQLITPINDIREAL